MTSGVTKEGKWGMGIQHTSFSRLKSRFLAEIKAKICLKIRTYWKNSCKIATRSEDPSPNLYWPPALRFASVYFAFLLLPCWVRF